MFQPQGFGRQTRWPGGWRPREGRKSACGRYYPGTPETARFKVIPPFRLAGVKAGPRPAHTYRWARREAAKAIKRQQRRAA